MEHGPLEIGSLVDGRHRLDHVLGVGGFATVYLGVDTESGREVAVKVLNQPILHRARFEREIQAVSQLRDPHTVRLFSHGEANGTPFIVFEYVPGRDLEEVLEDAKQLAPHVVEHVLRQLLMSLAEAHRAGVIHRDLKPANIRVFTSGDDPWFVKLLDFGIARFEDPPSEAKLTKTGELVGTPKYMSPEQLTGSRVGPPGDIYSLGMVAFEMLVGLEEMHGSRWSDQIERLRTGHLFAVDSSYAHLDHVLTKMTARNPLHRFQSAEAVLNALDNPELLPAPAKPEPAAPLPRAPTASSSESSTVRPGRVHSSAEVQHIDPNRDPRLSIAIGVVAVVAILAGVLAISWRMSDDEPPPPTSTRNLGSMLVGGGEQPVVEPEPLETTADAAAADPRPRWAQVDPVESGCGAERLPRGIMQRTIGIPGTFGESLREYIVRVPAGYHADRPHPVWLLFQTVVFDVEDFIAMAALEEFADEHGVILVGFVKRDEMHMFEEADKSLVARALAATAEDLCIDRGRVFGFAHGKGGDFARKVACDLDLAAIATIGDWAERGPHCDEPMPFIKFSGDDDRYSRPGPDGMNCLGEGPLLKRAVVDAEWRPHNGCKGEKQPWGGGPARKECATWTCETPYVICEYPGGHFFPRGKLDLIVDLCQSEQPDFPIVEVAHQFFESIAPEKPIE